MLHDSQSNDQGLFMGVLLKSFKPEKVGRVTPCAPLFLQNVNSEMLQKHGVPPRCEAGSVAFCLAAFRS
jgi:hypothetical protein